jgi:hypothetical protein
VDVKPEKIHPPVETTGPTMCGSLRGTDYFAADEEDEHVP